jgi:transposase-like protein
MQTDSTTLKRIEIKRVLKRHFGSVTELAKELQLKPQTISKWLKGTFDSARIAEAAQRKAIELMEREKKNAA